MPELRIHSAIFFLPGPGEGDGPWQFLIGAQVGTNGVNALAILGTNLLSAQVWRVDGGASPSGEPQSIADILCTNGVLRAPARFAIEWKNTSDLDPNADSDGDGLSDWDELFRLGTDPNQADSDGDGLSDGAAASRFPTSPNRRTRFRNPNPNPNLDEVLIKRGGVRAPAGRHGGEGP